jgi:predicted DNA repair protein MutK
VVFAVAMGSLRNKAILVPVALLLGQFLPWLVHPLLVLGGVYLCLEGAEKLAHPKAGHAEKSGPIPVSDPAASEKEKVRGAIKTDFVLSAEILAIALGNAADAGFAVRAGVLVVVALAMTAGVYGLVALIVKIDDAGLWLSGRPNALASRTGRALVAGAPWLMKILSVVGTVAMFLVGGGIVAHSMPAPDFGNAILRSLAEGALGLATGGLALAMLRFAKYCRSLIRSRAAG